MERLTNEEVRVDESMDRYLGPRSVLEGMKPKLLDLVLNGPVLNSVSKAALRQIIRQLYSALAAYEDTGLLVVLPCKPGDTVYSIFGAEVIEKTVGRVIINGYTTPRIWVDLDCSFLSSVTKRWDLGIGKDFFLTREEAEKALEAMKNGN